MEEQAVVVGTSNESTPTRLAYSRPGLDTRVLALGRPDGFDGSERTCPLALWTLSGSALSPCCDGGIPRAARVVRAARAAHAARAAEGEYRACISFVERPMCVIERVVDGVRANWYRGVNRIDPLDDADMIDRVLVCELGVESPTVEGVGERTLGKRDENEVAIDCKNDGRRTDFVSLVLGRPGRHVGTGWPQSSWAWISDRGLISTPSLAVLLDGRLV